jgi:hypothetical protein
MIEIIGGGALAYIIYSATVGLLPGIMLKPLLLLYPKGSDRPEEILGELYALPLRKRLPWAFWQVEVALFEGTFERIRARRRARANMPAHGDRRLTSWTVKSGPDGLIAAVEVRRPWGAEVKSLDITGRITISSLDEDRNVIDVRVVRADPDVAEAVARHRKSF